MFFPFGQKPPPLPPKGKHIRNIIVALPFFLVTSWVLYRRVVLGEERKVMPADKHVSPLNMVTGWEEVQQVKDAERAERAKIPKIPEIPDLELPGMK
ncbi:hypothetical protein SAICODRAFT_67127 [Saitoella complicata NRRL Y-17804]|nr:uncharacterized protein SAICODRAFT_67127 [Saitoella complicata NRRL Y-17804]ODQ51214.1 hypothetical protein SAICODRAFT_67127 [Saitoella complicata NRRL Y-17804]